MKTQYLILKEAPNPALYSPPEFSALRVRQFSQQILLPSSMKWTLGAYNPKSMQATKILYLTPMCSNNYIQVTWKIVLYFLVYYQ